MTEDLWLEQSQTDTALASLTIDTMNPDLLVLVDQRRMESTISYEIVIEPPNP